jgi:RNA polymerase sigma-70 factor (ECF subfamily)
MTADVRGDEFEKHRARLQAIAYRMLGSAAEAQDAVQDTWLRWQRSTLGGADVRSTEAFLTTIVTRLCLDRLDSARARRETYTGPWLPEPIVTDEHEVDAHSVSMAFMLLLERLSPIERAAYLLHAVFDNDHAQVAEILGKSEAAVRQAFHRAKAHLADSKPRYAPSKQRHGELLLAFVGACQAFDTAGLTAMLAEDAQAWSDGGGAVRAARKVVHGAESCAKMFVGLTKKGASPDGHIEIAELNGWPCVVLYRGDVIWGVIGIETDGVVIHAVHLINNPEKLAAVGKELAGRN